MLKQLVTAALCAAVCLLFSTAANAFDQAPRSEAWLEDFEQLKREMAAHYANLDWAVAERRIDLKQLSEQTAARLREAQSDAQAQQVIKSFLRTFGDEHISIQWPSADQRVGPAKNTAIKNDAAQNDKPSAPASLCDRLDFRARRTAPGIAFDRLPGFEPHHTADSKYFPIGVLVLPDDKRPNGKRRDDNKPSGKRIGLLRIAIFSEHWFPDLCETAASELGLHKDSPCDESCGDRVELRAADLLTAALERQLAALQAFSIDALLVDITGNGGGSDWVEPAARVLTRKPLRSPRIGFIKHAHWAKDFQSRLADIERDAAQATGPRRDMLKRAAGTYRRALVAAIEPVARDAVWQNKPVPALVSKDPELYGGGILPYARSGDFPESPSSGLLFYPSRYRYHEGAYAGPLLVLVDQNTASAAELFAAMLEDNAAAIVLGSPTVGVGFGYTNGGIPTLLKNSRAEIKMPDGVRYRSDGTNEAAGITPRVLVPWHANDNAYQRAMRVLAVLLKVNSGPGSSR
jgi:Peptidase family S41